MKTHTTKLLLTTAAKKMMLYKKTVDTQTPAEIAAARGPQKNSKPPHLLISGSWAKVKYPKVS